MERFRKIWYLFIIVCWETRSDRQEVDVLLHENETLCSVIVFWLRQPGVFFGTQAEQWFTPVISHEYTTTQRLKGGSQHQATVQRGNDKQTRTKKQNKNREARATKILGQRNKRSCDKVTTKAGQTGAYTPVNQSQVKHIGVSNHMTEEQHTTKIKQDIQIWNSSHNAGSNKRQNIKKKSKIQGITFNLKPWYIDCYVIAIELFLFFPPSANFISCTC